MWGNLQEELREAAWLALVVLSLSALSVAAGVALFSFG
jgi:hypothetical protein